MINTERLEEKLREHDVTNHNNLRKYCSPRKRDSPATNEYVFSLGDVGFRVYEILDKKINYKVLLHCGPAQKEIRGETAREIYETVDRYIKQKKAEIEGPHAQKIVQLERELGII